MLTYHFRQDISEWNDDTWAKNSAYFLYCREQERKESLT